MDRARSEPTPLATIEEAYERIDRVRDNPVWIHLVPRAEALARAKALAAPAGAASRRLPLYGVPFAVKDNIDVAGLPTTAGCPAYAYTPAAGATAVRKLLEAGAILVGKTNLDQFATGLVGTRSPYGACRNAFDARYISGGSSSGSALAVALGLCAFALGTDTAGSGRVPAAFNNLVGLKPTRGLVSTAGVVPACRSLDCVSIFARSCADAVGVLDVVEGHDPDDPYSRQPADAGFDALRFRFAVPRRDQLEFYGDAGYARLFDAALERLGALGGERVEIDFAPFLEVQSLLYGGSWIAERWAALGEFVDAQPGAVHPVTRRVIEEGRRFSAADAFRAQYRLAALARRCAAVWGSAEALVVPGAPTIYRLDEVEANPVELNSRLGRYTNFVNLLDLAAITVPAGFRADGLPFGVTLIGPAFTDRSLAALGARFAGEPAVVCTARSNVRVAVLGAHLSGMPLNHELTLRGGRMVRSARTSPHYRLHALTDQSPPKPGLVRVASGGAPIELEVWELPSSRYGSFVAGIPAPLGIGTLALEGGEQVQGFLCEPYAVAGRPDITAHGSWRNYLRSVQ